MQYYDGFNDYVPFKAINKACENLRNIASIRDVMNHDQLLFRHSQIKEWSREEFLELSLTGSKWYW